MAKNAPPKVQLTDEDVKKCIRLALQGTESGDYTPFNNWLGDRAREHKLDSAEQVWGLISDEIDRRRLAT